MPKKLFITTTLFLLLFVCLQMWFIAVQNTFYIHIASVCISLAALVIVGEHVLLTNRFANREVSILANSKKLEEDYFLVKEKKEKLVSLIDSFECGVLVITKDKKIGIANAKVKTLLAISDKHIVGKSLVELEKIEALKPFVQFIVDSDTSKAKKEFKMGDSLTLEAAISPLRLLNQDSGSLVLLQDITQRKEVEKVRADFVSLTVHQLSTPLSTIRLSLEMMLNGSFGKLTKEQKIIIDKSYQRSKMLIHLVRDLLTMNKIKEGGYEFRFSEVQFEQLAEFVINSNQEEIAKKKIVLKFEKPEQLLPTIMVDKEKVSLAMQNMFDNAVKYTLAGGKITVSVLSDTENVEFKVQDSGIGIPENQKEKMFSKFFRCQNAMKIEETGSGLGLFIAKSIVEGHGGKVWFTSKENEGSVFYISIPLKKVDSQV